MTSHWNASEQQRAPAEGSGEQEDTPASRAVTELRSTVCKKPQNLNSKCTEAWAGRSRDGWKIPESGERGGRWICGTQLQLDRSQEQLCRQQEVTARRGEPHGAEGQAFRPHPKKWGKLGVLDMLMSKWASRHARQTQFYIFTYLLKINCKKSKAKMKIENNNNKHYEGAVTHWY